MSRTYRNILPNHGAGRHPKGHAQALRNKIKGSKIPPGELDPVSYSHENFMPYKAARRMLKKGMTVEQVANHIAEKFHLEKNLALQIAEESTEDVKRKK